MQKTSKTTVATRAIGVVLAAAIIAACSGNSGSTENGDTESGTENSDTKSSDTDTDGTEGSDPEGSDTESGDSEGGDTGDGDTGSGDTESGDTETGDTDNNDTETGETATDDIPTTKVIEQWGITWTFETEVPYGRFANGDYWVLAPVTIVSITPDFDGEHHGFEVNPEDINRQGFDNRVDGFFASRVPTLPYEANPGESILKAISLEPLDDADCRPCLRTASVLTVLDEAPPDLGETTFRPAYFSTDKHLYSTNDLRTDLLPAYEGTPSAPSLNYELSRFERVHIEHKNDWTGAYLHPTENMEEYASSVSIENVEGALRLMLDDSLAEKLDLLVAYVQLGIDLYHMQKGGQTWPANGGHGEGRKLPIAFAAVLLDDAAMKDAVTNAGSEVFGENGGMYFSETADVVLWGQGDYSIEMYWENLVFDTGSRTLSDPYRWVDGGHRPGDSYQFCCLSLPYKANATAAYLFDEVYAIWGYEPFFEYVERWVADGAWTQPDPCAPPTGVCSGGNNAGAACTLASEPAVCTGDGGFCDATVKWDDDYGVLYGPDGVGGCILDTDESDGTGRFPLLHGTSADDGYYGSAFAEEMWDAYHP
jgi:hypothetical protein